MLRLKNAEMLALRRWEQQKRLGEDCQNHLAKLEDVCSENPQHFFRSTTLKGTTGQLQISDIL